MRTLHLTDPFISSFFENISFLSKVFLARISVVFCSCNFDNQLLQSHCTEIQNGNDLAKIFKRHFFFTSPRNENSCYQLLSTPIEGGDTELKQSCRASFTIP